MHHISRRGGACPRLAVGSCNFNPSAGESAQGSVYRCRAVDATLAAHPGGCALQRKMAAIPIVGNGLRAVPAAGGGDFKPTFGGFAT